MVDASTGLGGARRQLGDPVWILLGLVLMVLVVACANIANLLLARAAEREKEVGLRVSLGCCSARLMRQFLTESLLMAMLGGTLSIGVALGIPLVDVFTMEQQITRTLQRERMFAWLCGSFGVLALVLCVVGLYGLMSHATARRTPEIGIRMALGASGREVMLQVISEGMRLAAPGMVLGIPLAVYAASSRNARGCYRRGRSRIGHSSPQSGY